MSAKTPAMTPTTQTPEKITLHWSGDLTIRRISTLKDDVQAALDAAPHVFITIDGDAECDMTLMQLLCSCHRSAVSQNKSLVIRGEIPAQFKMIMALSGFSRHIGCSRDNTGSCLWEQIPRGTAA